MLRNDYRGTGYIDGGRRQISGWLYSALIENKPYDRFVGELVNPTSVSEGFARGILWRGTVNASMLPPMQAAQNISQVFMGVNLKCASCHDSFINDWTLADSYGLAAIYSDEHLELVQCDKPTGKTATLRFLYPQLGTLDDKTEKPERMKQFEQLVTSKANGRLPRTIVNRLLEAHHRADHHLAGVSASGGGVFAFETGLRLQRPAHTAADGRGILRCDRDAGRSVAANAGDDRAGFWRGKPAGRIEAATVDLDAGARRSGADSRAGKR
jgi:hypothetical protein